MTNISDAIPVPTTRKKFAVLDELEPGQSTTFPVSCYFSLCPCINYRQQRDGKKFTRRTQGDVVRVWRVE